MGLALDIGFLVTYLADGLTVAPSESRLSHLAVTGLFLLGLGFILFTTMLVVQAIAAQANRGSGSSEQHQ